MTVDEVILEEGISRQGLHRIHVMRMGAPVDIEKWIVEKIWAVDGIVETFYRYEEEDLDVHHLRLYWREERDAKYCVSTEGLEVDDGG